MMATYRFQCPQCNQELALAEDVATERSTVACPSCRSIISIPQDVIEDASARRAAALAKAEEQQRRREARAAERAARQERKRREAEEREREAERERRDREIEAALLAPEEAVPAEEVRTEETEVGARETGTGERVLAEAHPAMFRNRPAAFILSVLLCFAGIGVVILLIWRLECLGTKLTVTESRVILRHGVFAKHTTEVALADVRSVQVSQSLGQRIFGVGSLGIASSGQAGIEIVVSGIPRPQQFAELMRSGRRPPR